MITILGERGAFLIAKHSERGYTGGVSVSEELNIAPALVAVHTGLARFVGTVDGPGGATVGISSFAFMTDENQSKTVDFGNEDKWETAVYHARVNKVTISAHVHRGEMKAWWFLQVWA
ncbi:MAG TPA: hypothetical protein VGV87_23555 [Blastocatellia bacterium]|jgi:hypothetical protein|nr:hypothetical protein [Blastocatellia bacterium]